MLSDEELLAAYDRGFDDPSVPEVDNGKSWVVAGLRAVEAAVRADQIEADAEIAQTVQPPRHVFTETQLEGFRAARFNAVFAIRAQLEGDGA